MDVWEWVAVYRRGSVGRRQYISIWERVATQTAELGQLMMVLAVVVFNRGVRQGTKCTWKMYVRMRVGVFKRSVCGHGIFESRCLHTGKSVCVQVVRDCMGGDGKHLGSVQEQEC